ncbi:hypothetical protein [Algoriphagus sediminis]|uniref:Uncharacterized protein n=1 Tax=Algoriphagus sediminis TaxID=3057113 RepID=A0ABT7YCE7_9BACT|nr:hypothetical protein [Algoriphagus sediminis]MDN3204199.1 hypothetical protein [Algoriphagus sediminis]
MKRNKEDLVKIEEELEQTLSQQLSFAKQDSGNILRVGGIALAAGLLTYALIHRKSRRKERKIEKALEALEREGLLNEEIEERLTKPKKSSFWPSLGQRLMMVGLIYAKEKYLPELLKNLGINGEDQGEDI